MYLQNKNRIKIPKLYTIYIPNKCKYIMCIHTCTIKLYKISMKNLLFILHRVWSMSVCFAPIRFHFSVFNFLEPANNVWFHNDVAFLAAAIMF